MLEKNIKIHTARAILLSLMVSFIGATGLAWADYGHMRNEVNLFQNFLRNHPKVSAELRANPKLVNNKKYLDKHEELSKFLKRHPDVKRELVNHPSRIFGNYYRTDPSRLSHNQ
ncbi:MAG TPA: hypothetical protein VEI95_04215 [Acidobacteriota bacterium]|nr:hypothetical protein [Acidobacteriota bacterium]